MFYILNFKDHSFVSAPSNERVIEVVNEFISSGKAIEDEIEIVNAFDDNCRMTVGEFITLWS